MNGGQLIGGTRVPTWRGRREQRGALLQHRDGFFQQPGLAQLRLEVGEQQRRRGDLELPRRWRSGEPFDEGRRLCAGCLLSVNTG